MRTEFTVTVNGSDNEAIAASIEDSIDEADVSVGNEVTITVHTASYGGPRRNSRVIETLEQLDSEVWEDAQFVEETGDKRLEGSLWNGPSGVSFHEVSEIPV